MDTFKNRFKQLAFKIYVFLRAAGAAVVLGCIEVFGSPRGRRYLAGVALVGSRCCWSFARPCRWSRPARSASASTGSPAASPWSPRGRP